MKLNSKFKILAAIWFSLPLKHEKRYNVCHIWIIVMAAILDAILGLTDTVILDPIT